MGTQQFNESYPVFAGLSLDSTYVANTQTAIGVQANYPSRWDTLQAANDDTITHTVTVYLFDNPTYFPLGEVDVPAGAGNGTTPTVDLIQPFLPTTMHGFAVPTYYQLAVSVGEAITAGKHIYFSATGGQLS